MNTNVTKEEIVSSYNRLWVSLTNRTKILILSDKYDYIDEGDFEKIRYVIGCFGDESMEFIRTFINSPETFDDGYIVVVKIMAYFLGYRLMKNSGEKLRDPSVLGLMYFTVCNGF